MKSKDKKMKYKHIVVFLGIWFGGIEIMLCACIMDKATLSKKVWILLGMYGMSALTALGCLYALVKLYLFKTEG